MARMHGKVKEKIFCEISKKGDLQKEYVIDLLKEYDDRPEITKLIEQYYSNKANRIMSSFKDEYGVRECFAIKQNNDLTKYISVSNSNSLVDIAKVEQQLNKKQRGLGKSLKKAKARKQVLEGQITIDEYTKQIKILNKKVNV